MKICLQDGVISLLRSHPYNFKQCNQWFHQEIIAAFSQSQAGKQLQSSFLFFFSFLYFSYTHGEFCFVLTSHYFPSHTWLQISNFSSAIQLLFLQAAFFSYHYAFVFNSWNQEKARLIVPKFPKENVFTFLQFEITFLV